MSDTCGLGHPLPQGATLCPACGVGRLLEPPGAFDLAEATLLAAGATPEHARFSRLYGEGRLPGMQTAAENGDPTSTESMEGL